MSHVQAELDPSEAATPYKLRQARGRGQVPRSAELPSAVALLAGIVYFHAKGWESLGDMFRFDRMLLGQAGAASQGASAQWLWQVVEQGIEATFALLLPAMAAIVLAGILGNMVQTGAVFSLHPLRPDWQRVNPAAGLRRLFSVRTLFEAVRACLKLSVLAWLTFLALTALFAQFRQLADMTTPAYLQTMVGAAASLGMKLCLAIFIFALADIGYARHEFARKMRMSRREVREEFRRQEGDPRIRARMREIRRELLKRTRSLQRTSEADVVVINPTHVAVALRYKHGQSGAPVIVSKGAGVLAAAIRLIAARRRIPLVRHPSLARALHGKGAIDLPIPTELYADVARLMVWVLSLQGIGRAAAPDERPEPTA